MRGDFLISENSRNSVILKKQLAKIKLLSRICGLESCLLIYSYLMLFGKNTPAQMRKMTGLSKATMFRNLTLMLKAELIEKEEDKSVSDKRHSLNYYIKDDLLEITKETYSEDLKRYIQEQAKISILNEWIETLQILPLTLNQIMTKLLLTKQQRTSEISEEDCDKLVMLLTFKVEDMKNLKELTSKIQELLEVMKSSKAKTPRDWKIPLNNPVTVSINVLALNPDESLEDLGRKIEIER
ncbi:MAG: MarR family transcriptional regulator [Candidatus Hodarchaeota archaeon]